DARRPILQHTPALERPKHARLDISLHKDVIDAANTVPGMCQLKRQGAVVGQEEEPFDVEVEPSDRMEPGPDLRDEIEHARPPARVLASGEEASGLVEEHVAFRLG